MNKVVETRLAAGITQDALADMANINRRTLVRIEQGGVPHQQTAHRIAKALGTTPGELFDEVTHMGRPPRPAMLKRARK